MAVSAPSPVSFNPLVRVRDDIREARALDGRLPPGDLTFSPARTRRSLTDPLGMLLEAHARYGPVFTVRILYQPVVFALGPEANHTVLVSQADRFRWREGALRDLIPLLGDGLLTIDGAPHRRARRIMLPAFHRERLAEATGALVEEVDRALARWRTGDRLDIEHWSRELALRIALRCLLGLDPDGEARDLDLTAEWEQALAFYGRDYTLQAVRGPRTPWARMRRSRAVIAGLLEREVRRRRDGGGPTAGRGEDLLSLLVDARAEDGEPLSTTEIRDQALTLLFAGHDTTTATVAFLFWELARHPEVLARLRAELDEPTGGAPPAFAELAGGMPYLEQVLDETLRLYPPAWVGPRRVVRDVEIAGVRVPAGAHLNYSSYASHRLAEVWERPHAFDPDRFGPERGPAIPKGAYVPFGGGSRTCIGMRFGQLEIKAIAARVLARWDLVPPPGRRLEIRQTPTLGPVGGMPMRVSARR